MSMSIPNRKCLLLFAAVAFLACVSPAAAIIHTVNVSNNQFTPPTVQISHGDTVRWVRIAGTHTCTSDPSSPKDWDSGTLTGTPFQVVFSESDGNGPFPYHCDFHATMKGTITVQTLATAREESGTLPQGFTVEQNFPNPFNPKTTIRFTLARSAEVELSVYNVLGERVDFSDFGHLNAGNYVVDWDANSVKGIDLPTGVYFYRLRADEQTVTRKMVLLK